jgi:tight adherence protein B
LSIDNVTALLISIFTICILGLLAIFFWLIRQNTQDQVNNRVNVFIGARNPQDENYPSVSPNGNYSLPNKIQGFRGRVNQALSIFSTDDLRQRISSAYWPISDIEFISIRLLVTLIGGAIGWILPKSIIGGIGLGIIFFLIPGIVLERSIAKRRKRFQDQLLDFLVLIKGAVLAGYSLAQALDMAIKEIPAPASEEFGRVLREVKFGFPMDQALMNLAARMQSDDLQIVVTAIVLNSQMGGNLSTILEATIETIRDRIHLFSEIRSLTSYSRYVGMIISILPLLTALIVFLLNPDYFEAVKTSLITQIIFIIAFIGVVIGNILIRRVMKIRV